MTDRTIFPFPPVRADTPAPGAPGDDDGALVARVAAGDAEALGVLYDRHGAAAHGFARALVGGSADAADDVTAAAFAQLWHTAAAYDRRRGSVAAWVTTVTRARALDHVRARRHRLQAEGRAADAAATDAAVTAVSILLDSAEPADLAVARGEPARLVRGSLAELPTSQRRALELAFFGGLSHADVAAALGQPPDTTKTRIRAGLLKLREALRPLTAGGGV